MQKIRAVAGVLIVAGLAASTAHGADKNMKACTYLTSAEAGAAAGGAVGQPQESNTVITEGPSKGQTMGMCTWDAGSKGSIAVTVVPVPAGAWREAFLAQLNNQKWFEPLKAQGWTSQTRNVGDGMCLLITPPPSQKDVPRELLHAAASTSCYGASKGTGVGVAINGAPNVALEKVKALLDKAVSRVP